MRSTRREGLLWPLLAGTSLSGRIRRLTFAVFGLAAAAGVALVAFVAQTGYPVLSVAPLPLPGPALTVPGAALLPGGEADGYDGFGIVLPGIPVLGGEAAVVRRADAGAGAAVGTGDVLPALDATGGTNAGAAGSGVAGVPGFSGVGDRSVEVTAVTPAEEPTAPADPALASVPVAGSSPTTGLFVRNSVPPGLGEEGVVAPSAPVEPEVPVEPEPEPEVPVEPEAPAETAPPAGEGGPEGGGEESAPAAEAPAEPPAPAAPES